MLNVWGPLWIRLNRWLLHTYLQRTLPVGLWILDFLAMAAEELEKADIAQLSDKGSVYIRFSKYFPLKHVCWAVCGCVVKRCVNWGPLLLKYLTSGEGYGRVQVKQLHLYFSTVKDYMCDICERLQITNSKYLRCFGDVLLLNHDI